MYVWKAGEMEFEANLSLDDILKIVDEYGKEIGEELEVNQDGIVYEPVSEETNEPVWRLPVMEVRLKEKWQHMDDAYWYLGISDSRKKVAYVLNNFMRVIEIL